MEPNRAPHSFCFIGSCPSLTGPFVRYIVDHPKERDVTYATFARWVNTAELDELKAQLGYGRDIGLALSTDWHVTFHRSELPSGQPCYYFVWSAMKHVFVPCEMDFDLDHETALVARHDAASEDEPGAYGATIELTCSMLDPDADEEACATWDETGDMYREAARLADAAGANLRLHEHEERGTEYRDAYVDVAISGLEQLLDAFDRHGVGYDNIDLTEEPSRDLLDRLLRRYPPRSGVAINVQFGQDWGVLQRNGAVELPIMYRGAREGDPTTLRGPSYFSSAEVFARTYGPTAAFRLQLERPLYVDDAQWYEYASSSYLPIDEIVRRVQAGGYDSVVNVRGAASGEPLYTVLLLDPDAAQLVDLEPNIRAGTGAEFDGQRVVVAYNLHNCRVDREPRPGELCFTVRPSVSGRVLAHVDEILLEDVEFLVRESGLKRVRERGVREVFAFASGTARDPRRAARSGQLGSFSSWEGIAFNPFRDRSFVLRRDRSKPVWRADWVYFRDRRGIAKGVGSRRNPEGGGRITDAQELAMIADREGGLLG